MYCRRVTRKALNAAAVASAQQHVISIASCIWWFCRRVQPQRAASVVRRSAMRRVIGGGGRVLAAAYRPTSCRGIVGTAVLREYLSTTTVYELVYLICTYRYRAVCVLNLVHGDSCYYAARVRICQGYLFVTGCFKTISIIAHSSTAQNY
jgi:hypothetical protein